MSCLVSDSNSIPQTSLTQPPASDIHPSHQPKKPFKEQTKLLKHHLLLGSMVVVLGESRDWGEDFCDGGAGGRDAAIAEGVGDETACGFGVKVLFRNDAFQLLGLLRRDKDFPLRIHVDLRGDGIHELLDKVFLVAQRRAGIGTKLRRVACGSRIMLNRIMCLLRSCPYQ